MTAKQIDFLLSGYRHPTKDKALSGGKVYTYLDGTSTLSALWTDKDKTGSATNPVILDSSGKVEVYGDNIYKFRIYDSDDVFVEEITGLEYLSVIPVDINTISDLRDTVGTFANQSVNVLGYYIPGDGGGGPLRIWADSGIPGTYTDNGGSIIVPTGGDGSAAWLWEWSGPIDIRWFGAVLDGVTDDKVPFQNALNVGGDVKLPRGSCALSAQLNLSTGNNIIGDGKFTSKIIPLTPGMTVFSLDTVNLLELKQFSIESNVSDVIGINLNECFRIDVSQVEFLGCRYSWYAQDGGWLNFNECTSRHSASEESGGFVFRSSQGGDGTGKGNYGANLSSVNNCQFKVNSESGRPKYILLKRNANLLITNSEFIGNRSTCDCFVINDDAQGIHISNCAINSWGNGIFADIGTYVGETNRAPRAITLTNVEFDQSYFHAISAPNVENIVFDSCVITSSAWQTSATPFYFGSGTVKAQINNCTIAGYFGVGGIGVHLDGCDRVQVLGNKFDAVETAIKFSNTPTYCYVKDNDFTFAVTNNIGGTPGGSNNRISSNLNNDTLDLTPAIPATGVQITNDSGYDVDLVVADGTSTLANVVIDTILYKINGSGNIKLNAGDVMELNYTGGTPEMKWYSRK